MTSKRRLRIASYNINGINSRLHVLTRWLEEFQPDIVGLQELKCTDEAFPREAIEALGYSAIWHGQRSWNGVALLSKVGEPVETRRALPGDPNLEQSRYIEAAVCGILVGNMYAPNGNPKPGPKFDYKLAWLDALSDACAGPARQRGAGDPDRRLQRHPDRSGRLQARALGQGRAVRAGGAARNIASWSRRAGPTRSATSTRTSGSTPSGITGGIRSSATRASASIMRCSARPWPRS